MNFETFLPEILLALAVCAVVILCAWRAGRQNDGIRRAIERLESTVGAMGGMFGRQGEAVERSIQAEEERMARLGVQIEQRQVLSAQQMEARLAALTQQIDARLTDMAQRQEQTRQTMDKRAEAMQRDNSEKLEAMRRTVDEKLQKTLDERLSESFRQVSQRLEAVYRGLGEMQALASSVGDLKNVLTNVKTRGSWGEVQLGALLEQMLAPSQFARGVQVKARSQERVDFAVRMPGQGEEEVLLPIDAKFPQQDYIRLSEAYDIGDAAQIAQCRKALADAVKRQAKSIQEKYINPPATTDFAILYLPVEGLYAEALRQDGFVEGLQRDYRVTVAGPTTLSALLTSLQMGFRTLAIEKRSTEVWQLLGSVKAAFGNFHSALEKTQRALKTATTSIDDAARKTATIERRLRAVEEMPVEQAREVLGEQAEEEEETEAPDGE